MNTAINLLGETEQALRTGRLRSLIEKAGIVCALIRDNANIYWLTGRVFRGYIYIDTRL